jgi:hypothetical protein
VLKLYLYHEYATFTYIYAIVMPKLHLYTTVRQFSNVYGIFVLMAKFTKVLEGWQVC